MDISSILLATTHLDDNIRKQAEQQLAAAEQQNLALFMVTLAGELSSETKPPESRRLAGIILKNLLTAKDTAVRLQRQQRWAEAIDEATRTQIKTCAMQTLASTVQPARRAASQVVAQIAAAELPRSMWVEVIQLLLQNMSSTTDIIREASLETLGFICEEIDPAILRMQADKILMAVIHGMRSEEPVESVKYAACVALYNSLLFIKSNFAVKRERDYIMNVLVQACTYKSATKTSVQIREAAYECLVRIVGLYYEHLVDYMEGLFRMTFEAMTNDVESIVQQAIEFWSSICDEEIEMLDDMEDGGPPPKYFIRTALQFLVPQLLGTLTRQEEDQDEDTWDVAMAGGTCLSLVAATVRDEIVPYVMPFVQNNVNHENWRNREAATMAFGCILEGPSTQSLAALVEQGVPVLLTRLKDSNINVQDTASWAIGRMCEHQPANIQDKWYPHLLGGLLEALRFPPRVAYHSAWAIHNIAEANEVDEDEPEQTTRLSQYWAGLVEGLLNAADREDSTENSLRSSCYEALNMLIQVAPGDCMAHVQQLMPAMIARLEKTFQMQIVSMDDKTEQSELQSLLCGCLQVLTQKLGASMKPLADRLMTLYLQLFHFKNATLYEEALMAIGAIANVTEAEFEKYMPHFQPLLKIALLSVEDYQVCNIAVGVVGDICRALNARVAPYCDEIVQFLLQNLQNQTLHRSVKPAILSAFGDIALAIGGMFEKYIPFVIPMLQQAAAMPISTDTYEMREFVNQLREGIFEAYTGIIQGLKADRKAAAMLQYVEHIVSFAQHVTQDKDRSEDVTRVMVGVLGDIAHSLGSQVRTLVQRPFVEQLIAECAAFPDPAAQETAAWARQKIARA